MLFGLLNVLLGLWWSRIIQGALCRTCCVCWL